MKISVTLQVMVKLDNVDAIFMTSSITTTSHTKHVDIRYKYVNENVEDGIVNTIFIKSAENENNSHKKLNC